MPIENPYYSAAVHGDFELADVHGHASLFGLSPAYVEQVDDALRKSLQTQV